jgi:hypothetical protein
LLELLRRLGMEQFGSGHYRSLSAWLEPTAMQTSRGMVLAKAIVDELRRRLIVLPPIPVIDRLCAEASTRAQRKSFVLLTRDLSLEKRSALDALLELRNGGSYSTLSWLRLNAGAPTPKAVMSFHRNFRIGFIRIGSFRLHAKAPSARSINSRSTSPTADTERWLRC